MAPTYTTGIPAQHETMTLLRFNAVERHFYKKQHQGVAAAIRKAMPVKALRRAPPAAAAACPGCFPCWCLPLLSHPCSLSHLLQLLLLPLKRRVFSSAASLLAGSWRGRGP